MAIFKKFKDEKIAEYFKVLMRFLGESMKKLLELKESALEKSDFFCHWLPLYKSFKNI